MKKINYKVVFVLFVFVITVCLYTTENIEQLHTSLNSASDLNKAKILYELAIQTDSSELNKRIDYCNQAKMKAIEYEDDKLLLNTLNLKASIYKDAGDVENYSSAILEYIETYKKISQLEMETNKRQITKQILIRNAFMIAFLIFLNIAFIIFARYRLKTADHLKLEKANMKLKEISRTDPLTEVSNRRDILEKIEYETLRFERSNRTFCLLMGDIDHFKSINDTYGHECGDFVLKELVKTMVSGLRKQDVVSRWGGEEFMLLLPETQLVGGKVAAEKIRQKIAQNKFEYQDKIISVTITFGVSEIANDKTIDSCIKEADKALYKGKNKGRNRVEVFDPHNVLIG